MDIPYGQGRVCGIMSVMKKYFNSLFARVFASLAVLTLTSFNGLAFAATTTSSHPPIIKLRHGTSSNWSGYAAYNSTFNSVSASWTQPSLKCSSGDGYSSYWVGLDGYNTSTVEQLGTEGDCSGGSASFYAWFEMYPKPGYYINTITVHPGDVFNASVTYSGGKYTLSLTDVTTNKSFSTSQRMNKAQRASAEAIVEAPWSGGVLPLANFGTANFTNSLANGKALGSYANLDPITMLNPYGMKSTPSAFDTSTLKIFSLTWSN